MAKCECQWLSWIPRCYGHCKSQQVQLPDRWRTEVSHIAKKDKIARWGTEIKPEMVELPIAKVAEDTMIRPKSLMDVFARTPTSKSEVVELPIAKVAEEIAGPEEDLSAAKNDVPEVEDAPKIKPEEEDVPKIKP